MLSFFPRGFILLFISLFSQPLQADELRLAVASNFLATLEQIKTRFEKNSPHQLQISSGSTGKLYAQIKNGAPYDIFLAADKARPFLLAEHGLAVKPQLYAEGQLVLWSKVPELIGKNSQDCMQAFTKLKFQKLAIANPKTAPYGLAAQQFLVKNNVWQSVQGKLVRGENIGQVLQFSRSGAVEFSLLARAQLNDEKAPAASCQYLVPAEQHEPIEQYAVLLKSSANKPVANEFMAFLSSAEIKQLITTQGYLSRD